MHTHTNMADTDNAYLRDRVGCYVPIARTVRINKLLQCTGYLPLLLLLLRIILILVLVRHAFSLTLQA